MRVLTWFCEDWRASLLSLRLGFGVSSIDCASFSLAFFICFWFYLPLGRRDAVGAKQQRERRSSTEHGGANEGLAGFGVAGGCHVVRICGDLLDSAGNDRVFC